MDRKKRKYISVYFDDKPLDENKKRDLTVAFSPSEELYDVCKNFGSSEIKETIGIYSYSQLIKKAEKDHRKLSNFIKTRLKEKLLK